MSQWDEAATLSITAADTVFGPATVAAEVALDVSDLPLIRFHTEAALSAGLDRFTWQGLLAEVDRTKRAIANYPPTPVLPALRLDDVARPKWSEL
jgi:hypothetical protein